MIEYERNPAIPEVPNMYNILDLFANFQNNWLHLRYVWALLFGLLFAFFVAKRLMKVLKGDDDD